MGFAKEFADRVCFFSDGRIAEQGTPQEIFGAPRNERTQAFLRAVMEALRAHGTGISLCGRNVIELVARCFNQVSRGLIILNPSLY
jgi:ABC-type dipeptide/oligopeptide/nickel transport system ATPase component